MNANAKVTPIDRLGLTLFFAALLHAIIILGIGFTLDPPKKQPPSDRTLEIMVVQNPVKTEKPEKADFLAQTTQDGGGNVEEKVRPTTAPPRPQIEQPAPVVETRPTPEPQAAPPAPETKKVLTQEKPAPRKILTRPRPKPAPPQKKRVSAAQLLASTDEEIKRLTAELDRKTSAYAKRPRRKQLTAKTQEYQYASYLDAWRRKVEKIGNLNYPDEAKRRKLYGNLILHVEVRADGSVRAINVLTSSGHKLLDDAAIRIVRLASPFAPFPAEIRREVDVLDIIRTWQFQSSNRLFSR